MVEFRWIQTSFLLIKVLQITAVTGPLRLSISVRDGDEVTLTCENATDDNCGSTTWLFSVQSTVTLFEYGQIQKDARSASRLSVTEKCSLAIKKVTINDVGQYTCRHFSEGQKCSETSVFLYVVTGKETVPGEDTTAATTKLPKIRTMEKNWWWYVIVFVGVAAVLIIVAAVMKWRRTKANKKGMDDNTADPEDGVHYASISYTRKTDNKVQIRGNDDNDGDAVTYSAVKASSCSTGGSADPSSLYATVNKPNK